MRPLKHDQLSALRGTLCMGFDAAAGVVSVVERMHGTIQQKPSPIGGVPSPTANGIAGLVYRSVRRSVKLLGRGIDSSLALLPTLPGGDETPRRLAYLATLNGVCGDYLSRTRNPLSLEMSLRLDGKPIDAANPSLSLATVATQPPSGRLLVLVHGLCRTDLGWNRNGHDHGAALAKETGHTGLYLRYNTGVHIAENGRLFAALLETLAARWPVPLREISIIGHSMGGLVARSACFFANEQTHAWLNNLRTLVFLGTPHLGAPLERAGHWLDTLLDSSPYSAPLTQLGKLRSAGIQDLRHGTITLGEHRSVPLPQNVQCYAAAGTLGQRRGAVAERLVGDGLVPLNSALGRAGDGTQILDFSPAHQWIGEKIGHLDLLCRPEVYDQLRIWLNGATIIDAIK